MKTRLVIILAILFALPINLLNGATFQAPKVKAADFNSSNLISDGEFVSTDSMSAAEVQEFLSSRGSYLAGFSENGRSAAQIIWDAAHGYGDASGTINGVCINSSTGTVSPKVILVTLQKEQSLVSATSPSAGALNAAMGYACPDGGGCNPSYAGFTKQVENGAWQLRYNYERASGRGFSDYQVGQGFNFDGNTGTFSNRATASLYRYTPHVYNGNYNFWNLYYNTYNFALGPFSYSWVTQNAYPTIARGEAAQFSLTVKNTGSETWTSNVVRLGTDRSRDRSPAFLRESGDGSPYPSGWVSSNRVAMQQASVASGENATFVFYMQALADMAPGNYREYFRLVADGVTWMQDYGIYWDVKVLSTAETYSYSWVTQNGYPTVNQGQATQFSLTVKNTGRTSWTPNVVRLGTDRPIDQAPAFLRESGDGSPYPSGWVSPNRVAMQQSSVAPGENATFVFYMQAPANMKAGTYRQYFRLVADGVTWMQDYGIYWDITVRQP